MSHSADEAVQRAEQLEREAHDAIAEFSLEDALRLVHEAHAIREVSQGDGHADLSYIYSAVREIAPLLSPTAVVVTKSTVPVGTGDEIERILREVRPEADMQVVSNPESCAKARPSTTSSTRTAS